MGVLLMAGSLALFLCWLPRLQQLQFIAIEIYLVPRKRVRSFVIVKVLSGFLVFCDRNRTTGSDYRQLGGMERASIENAQTLHRPSPTVNSHSRVVDYYPNNTVIRTPQRCFYASPIFCDAQQPFYSKY
jgi:hypothetical protein